MHVYIESYSIKGLKNMIENHFTVIQNLAKHTNDISESWTDNRIQGHQKTIATEIKERLEQIGELQDAIKIKQVISENEGNSYNVVYNGSYLEERFEYYEDSIMEAIKTAYSESLVNQDGLFYVEKSNPKYPQLGEGDVLIAFREGKVVNYYAK